uniref:Thymus, brain and testes associated n=1 Tax=Latimeria chalumnae TaxID=7897 RepID=H3AYB9_LATCH
VSGPFQSKEVLNSKTKNETLAFNTPLRFSGDVFRPQSKSSSRFGMLSHHSFFSRHNPHPHRVTHIQGNNGTTHKFSQVYNQGRNITLVLIVNQDSKLSDPSNFGAVPRVTICNSTSNKVPCLVFAPVPFSEAWREELRELTTKVCLSPSTEPQQKKEEVVHRTTQYSAQTGRIIPPSSRFASRHASRQAYRNNARNKNKFTAPPIKDQELLVLELLCQILQTDSLSSVQQWLLSAGQREKDLVMGMIQTAMSNSQFNYQHFSENSEEGLHLKFIDNYINTTVKFYQEQKHEPIKEDDKPEHIGTAEVLQIHKPAPNQEASKQDTQN